MCSEAFDVAHGKHSAVVAGKSSLLAAALGELAVAEGQVSVRGSVAYVPQRPWILSGTVRCQSCRSMNGSCRVPTLTASRGMHLFPMYHKRALALSGDPICKSMPEISTLVRQMRMHVCED